MSVLNYITLSHLKKVIAGIAQRFKEIEGKINKTNTDITAINNNITSVNEEISTIKEGKLIKRGAGTESEIFNSETENDYYLVSSASGNYSHSGGYFGEANGDYSYAEGTYFYSSGFYLRLTSSDNAGISFTVSNYDGVWNANKFPSLINYYLRFNSYIIRKVVNEQKTDGIITSITIDSPFSGSNIISNKDAYLVGCIANGLSSYAKGTQAFAMGNYSHAEGYAVLSYGAYSYAQGNYARALNTFAHAEGYGTIASGSDSSHAEGYQTTASGNYGAHAEGDQTTASGDNGAHSEGYGTKASGRYSHSEGDLTIASNAACHAEGVLSRATAANSHAEGTYGSFSVLLTGNADAVTYSVGSDAPYIYGNAFVIGAKITNPNGAINTSSHVVVAATNTNGYLTSITLDKTLDSSSSVSKSYTLHIGTLAAGTGSHAEGAYTRAGGSYSHAEGVGTVANGHYQHAQGKYNIIDDDYYADIVGNGSGVSNRSNAYTLDWDGNGWYAGKLTVSAAPTNDMDVATKKYVDDNTGETNADWEESDSTDSSYILNKPSIKAGTGENSIMEGDMSQGNNAAIYTIYITGEARATTFTYTTNDTFPNSLIRSTDFYVASVDGITNALGRQLIESIDTTNNTITFRRYISTSALSNIKVNIFYQYTSAYGKDSHIEGSRNIALGDHSHAEGNNSKTVGAFSHAEGSSIAAGNYSHSEGLTSKAIGLSSHAEGSLTTASGDTSHAEGYETTASGNYSHAEGQDTTASGSYSHAEGSGTKAQRRSQHVFGEYNVLDTGGTDGTTRGTYIEIVGKGTSDSALSNARTLDWSGNEVLAGKLTVGIAPTNNMDVATKQYVDDATASITTNLSGLTDTTISSPTDGQLLKYNATTSKWENVTLSLAINNNVIQLKEGNTVISSVTLPIYNGGVSS